jgi:hypothetical protein
MKQRRYSGRKRDAWSIPEGEPFVWQTRELIQSPAWRGRSINLVRLLDSLLDEHMGHAGTHNGNLIQTYDQLERAGLTRRLIPRTIAEGEARGLVVVERGGRKGHVENHLNRYRLTWFGTRRRDEFSGWVHEPPTNEWQRVTEAQVQTTLEEWERRKAQAAEWRRKNRKQVSENAPVRVSESALAQVSDSARRNRQSLDPAEKPIVSESPPLSTSRSGAARRAG